MPAKSPTLAPAPADAPTPGPMIAPEPAPAPIDLHAVASAEPLARAERMYDPAFPAVPRALIGDGRFVEVQRERYASGKSGPYVVAFILPRTDKSTGKTVESVARVPYGDFRAAIDALATVGIKL
jgi:hypothetical protein